MRAYGNAKLANLLTVYELTWRLEGRGITVNALHARYVATDILPLDTATGPVRLLKPFCRQGAGSRGVLWDQVTKNSWVAAVIGGEPVSVATRC